jgi:hypothetical protein
VLVCAEALGIVGALRTGPLIVLLVVVATAAWVWDARAPTAGARPGAVVPAVDGAPQPPPGTAGPPTPRLARLWPLVAIAVVGAQWLLATADSLGGGMFNFDTLWYHMPFAAEYALSGSITAIHFTQADPWVAYYPANSELLHAVGIVLLRGDFLSPLINLGWLAVLLLGAWCLGRPWRLEAQTLVAGCLVAGLPVLASTQPGEAFNDTAGLAMLVAATALLLNAAGPRALIPAGLALGWAAGTKFTFIVPALVLVVGVGLPGRWGPPAARTGARGARVARVAALGLPGLLTAGWWYLHDLVLIGNPLGTRLALGPFVLPGPRSPLAAASQQTVVSQLRHPSLWASRFLPGLTHALGVAWPLLVLGAAVALATAIARPVTGPVRMLAVAAGAAAVTYLLLPTGAAGLGTGTVLFEVNLRYITPALALALALVPLAVAQRAPRRSSWVVPAMVLTLVVAQAEPSLWPAAPARHVAFLVLTAALMAAVAAAWARRGSLRRLGRFGRPAAAVLVLVLALGGAFVAQRHYLQRRYRAGAASNGLQAIYAWAQSVSHARIALYGSVEQYPLYGALVTNRVEYLGVRTPGGGYRPIGDCSTWRTAIDRDHARFVVMTPGPTGTVPLSWTAADPAARLVLSPGHGAAVYSLAGALHPGRCGSR